MDFRPLAKQERDDLIRALRGNGEGTNAVLMGRDTSFAGEKAEVDEDAETISAIKSVPTHYAH
jgi:hypothetical protein